MGRKAAGNRGQGHFQDQARQLTSSAFGRAILWLPLGRDTTFTQSKIALRATRRETVAVCSHIGDWYE
jgi:hypothetical protein